MVEALEECIAFVKSTFTTSLISHGESLRLFVEGGGEGGQQRGAVSIMGADTVGSVAVEVVSQLSRTRMCSPGFLMEEGGGAEAEAEAEAVAVADPADCGEDPMSMDAILPTILAPALSLCASIDDLLLLKTAVKAAEEGGASKEKCYVWGQACDSRVGIMVEFIVREQAGEVLTLCGLKEVLALIETEGEGSVPLSQVIGLEPQVVKGKIDEFYATLYSPPIPTYSEISDDKVRAEARRATGEKVLSGYAVLYDTVEDDKNGYAEGGVFCKHSPAQVKVLLNI